MKNLLFWIWQWTWGFPQSLLGLIIYLLNLDKKHEIYRGCIVTPWNKGGSLGVGMFLFLGINKESSVLKKRAVRLIYSTEKNRLNIS